VDDDADAEMEKDNCGPTQVLRWAWTQLHTHRTARTSAPLPMALYCLLVGWLALWRAIEMAVVFVVFTEAVEAAVADQAPAWQLEVCSFTCSFAVPGPLRIELRTPCLLEDRY
jgi:hypothetical protein